MTWKSLVGFLALSALLGAQTPKENLQRSIGANTVAGANSGVPFKLDTITLLRATSVQTVSSGQTVQIAGYYASGDGGGGAYVYSSGSSTADNGGTIIAPNSGSGRWLLQYVGPLKLEQFGGGISATAAQNNVAFTNALAVGGTVQLNAGSYQISQPVNLTQNGTTLRGLGINVTNIVNSAGSPTFNFLTASMGLTDIGLSGFSIVTPGLAYGLTNYLSLYLKQLTRVRVDHVQLQGLMARFDQCTDVYVDSCRSISSSYMSFLFSNDTNVVCTRSYGTLSWSAFMTDGSYNCTLTDNQAYDCYHEAFRIEDSQRVIVANNQCTLCMSGIVVYGPQVLIADNTQDVTVANNVFDRCYETDLSTLPWSSGASGFATSTKLMVDRTSFLGNKIVGATGEAVQLSDFASNTVVNASFATTCEAQSIVSNSYLNLNVTGDRIYTADTSTNYSAGWFCYINFPSGIDLSSNRYLTVDMFFGSGTSMADNVFGVKFYSAVDQGGSVLGTADLYNSGVRYNCLPTLFTAPAALTNVKCIEFDLNSPLTGVGSWVISNLMHGLSARIAYAHSYLDTSTLNVDVRDSWESNFSNPEPKIFNFPPTPSRESGDNWNMVNSSVSPGALANGSQQVFSITTNESYPGCRILVSYDQDLKGTQLWGAAFDGSLRIYQLNNTGSSQTVSDGTLRVEIQNSYVP